MSKRSFTNLLFYRFCRLVCRIACLLFFRLRVEGREHIPHSGGVILLANHQSHLDPILAGVACNRPLHPMARESLFHNGIFGWLIRTLGAIPIDRDGFGLAGIRGTLRSLKSNQVVLVFGEGTRSPDGQLRSFKAGFCTLARRGKVPILPLAISGAFDAFPRNSKFPRPAKIVVRFAEVITPEDYDQLSDDELVAEAEARIREKFLASECNSPSKRQSKLNDER